MIMAIRRCLVLVLALQVALAPARALAHPSAPADDAVRVAGALPVAGDVGSPAAGIGSAAGAVGAVGDAGSAAGVSAQAAQTAPNEPALWRLLVGQLDAATRIAVRLKDGSRVEGTVLAVTEETFTIKPRTRIPVPARELAFADVATIERKAPSMSPGKKVLLGVGIGTAVYVIVGAVLLAAIGYD